MMSLSWAACTAGDSSQRAHTSAWLFRIGSRPIAQGLAAAGEVRSKHMFGHYDLDAERIPGGFRVSRGLPGILGKVQIQTMDLE